MMTTWVKRWVTPDSIGKLGSELKIKSIHEEELSKTCAGSLIS